MNIFLKTTGIKISYGFAFLFYLPLKISINYQKFRTVSHLILFSIEHFTTPSKISCSFSCLLCFLWTLF